MLPLFAPLEGGKSFFSTGHVGFSRAAGRQELLLPAKIERRGIESCLLIICIGRLRRGTGAGKRTFRCLEIAFVDLTHFETFLLCCDLFLRSRQLRIRHVCL